MKVYIAGLVSKGGTLSQVECEANAALFQAARDHLRQAGHDPVDPTTLVPVLTGPESHARAMRVCLRALLDCDAICKLPGWETSPGADLEVRVARATRMPEMHAP